MTGIRHINAISLYVADVARSAEFKGRGFEAEVMEAGPGNIVVTLENMLLNLLDMSLAYGPTGPDRGPLPLELNIWVEDVDAVYAELLTRGVAFIAPPTDQPWGMRNISFIDSGGHRLEIAQPLGQ